MTKRRKRYQIEPSAKILSFVPNVLVAVLMLMVSAVLADIFEKIRAIPGVTIVKTGERQRNISENDNFCRGIRSK